MHLDLVSSINSYSLNLKQRAYNQLSIPHTHVEGLEIRKLRMNVDYEDEKHMVQKLSLGQSDPNVVTKVILLVGATGTGKSTLINNMVNYIFKVDFKDDFRYILIDDKDAQEQSQTERHTDWTTAYTFNHFDGMPFEYNLMLIDTPGFGDTSGMKKEHEMMQQLEILFKLNYGIDFVDGVGFVIPSSEGQLTQAQRYVFEGISSMFGKDIKNNINVMATFADGKTPPVIDALKEANVEYHGIYKFNSSALYANNKASKEDGKDLLNICELYWDMGYKNVENFFLNLVKSERASLKLTKEVLNERSKLQQVLLDLQNLDQKITTGNLCMICKDALQGKNANMEEREIGNDLENIVRNLENLARTSEVTARKIENNMESTIQRLKKHMERIQEIALKPYPLSKAYMQLNVLHFPVLSSKSIACVNL